MMAKFVQYTIQGAELDSSDRDPPPRCHPGTRTAVIDDMRLWLRDPTRRNSKRLLWLVGPAGVGKSAIMQTLAELESEFVPVVDLDLLAGLSEGGNQQIAQPTIFATLFFSAHNRRNDSSMVITTLAYQIALQHQVYREHVCSKIKANPSLLRKSISTQFKEFIVEPFITSKVYQRLNPVLIFIDGLDECKGQREQLLILSLISDFASKYPEISITVSDPESGSTMKHLVTPILWVVASRPEAYIKAHLDSLSFFDKQEVAIDSTTSCQDVERFLRAKFGEIRASDQLLRSLSRQWPLEHKFLKLVTAAVGLFAYAEAAIQFIGDMTAGDPTSRFELVLDLIDKTSSLKFEIKRSINAAPMAQLDTLYRHILSQVQPDTMSCTQEILEFIIFSGDLPLERSIVSLSTMCDWTGVAPNLMYGALQQLHSVIRVPNPDDALRQPLRIHHKSFSDFLIDPKRSGISLGGPYQEECRMISRGIRILQDVSRCGTDIPNPDVYSAIPFTWRYSRATSKDLENKRCHLYVMASNAVTRLSSLTLDFSMPAVAHALKVMYITSLDGDHDDLPRPLMSLVFDDQSELAQLLAKDATVRSVPFSLLVSDSSRNPVQNKEFTSRLKRLSGYFRHPRVRIFFGNKLQGFVQCGYGPHASYYRYDCSTIYATLENQSKRGGGVYNYVYSLFQ